MRILTRASLAALIALTIGVATAGAAPITCTQNIGGTVYTGTVDPAIQCDGPYDGNDVYPSDLTLFGSTWLAQDKDDEPEEAPENGATEDALTLDGLGELSGTFTIDPAETQCGLVDCNAFVIALKWDGVYAYWDLGVITSKTTFDWDVDPNALSHASLYGRFVNVPEPSLLLLFGTGAAVGLRRRIRRQSR